MDAHLQKLIDAYENADKIFHATKYWDAYKQDILKEMSRLDLKTFRSGKHPVFQTFGFNETRKWKLTRFKPRLLATASVIKGTLFQGWALHPYSISYEDVQSIAYRHCKYYGEHCGALPISSLEVSTTGSPADYFNIDDKGYTMQFLGFYIRYAFVQQQLKFRGDEVIVELGSGSGHQVEILKKLYPEMTILCFDLPAQLYLCEKYLTEALGQDHVVSSDQTITWSNLDKVEKGKVHFFGNWQMPMVKGFDHDLFWNAASFGEMEPDVVKNYLSYVKDTAKHVYLMQARNGKEVNRVEKPITFEDYDKWLAGFELMASQDAYRAHMRMKQTGGYFEAIWKKS